MPNKQVSQRRLIASMIIPIAFLFMACGKSEPDYTAEDARTFHEWRDAVDATPAKLISAAAETGRSVLFAQDDAMRTDTVVLAECLLPTLYDFGLREWGVYFVDSALQEDLDDLVLLRDDISDKEAEGAVEKLLFATDASFGYADYRDFILYARNFNAGLENDEEPLRLRGISTDGDPDYKALFPAEGTGDDPEASEVTETETADQESGEPAAPDESFPGIIWILAEDLPRFSGDGNTSTNYVIAHALPREGILETESAIRDLRDRTFAFETAELPFKGWNPTPQEAAADLVIVTPFPFETAKSIPGFITEESSAEAARDFPDLRLKTPSQGAASRMNRLIKRRPGQYEKTVEKSLR